MRILISFISLFLFSCSGMNESSEKESNSSISTTERLIVYPESQQDKNGFSLDDALAKAKILLSAKKNVEIRLTSGTYYLTKPIILGPEFSGTKEQPFIIRADENATVILSAAKLLDVNWQTNNQLMKAQLSVDKIDQLYINGQKQISARFPNFDSSVQVFNGYAADAISPERVATWKNPKGGFVHALHEGRWGGMHYLIKGVTNQGELTLEGGFQNNRQSPMHKKYRYVENIFEELDAPGEWYMLELKYHS